MALLTSFVRDAKKLVIPLDIAEVPESHSGARLAREVHRILTEFGIEDKVSYYLHTEYLQRLTFAHIADSGPHP